MAIGLKPRDVLRGLSDRLPRWAREGVGAVVGFSLAVVLLLAFYAALVIPPAAFLELLDGQTRDRGAVGVRVAMLLVWIFWLAAVHQASRSDDDARSARSELREARDELEAVRVREGRARMEVGRLNRELSDLAYDKSGAIVICGACENPIDNPAWERVDARAKERRIARDREEEAERVSMLAAAKRVPMGDQCVLCRGHVNDTDVKYSVLRAPSDETEEPLLLDGHICRSCSRRVQL